MERKLTAMRDVLLHVEEHLPFTGSLRQLNPSEVNSECGEEEVNYAIYLMLDCGYLDGVWNPQPHAPSLPQIRAITHDGHEFLELARDPDVWSSIAKALDEMAANPRSIEVLMGIAKQLVEEKLFDALHPAPQPGQSRAAYAHSAPSTNAGA